MSDTYIKDGIEYNLFNPLGVPESELPTIYCFINDVSTIDGVIPIVDAIVVHEGGEILGKNMFVSAQEAAKIAGCYPGFGDEYLNVCKGYFKNGFKMDFVGYDDVPTHRGVNAAMKLHGGTHHFLLHIDHQQ